MIFIMKYLYISLCLIVCNRSISVLVWRSFRDISNLYTNTTLRWFSIYVIIHLPSQNNIKQYLTNWNEYSFYTDCTQIYIKLVIWDRKWLILQTAIKVKCHEFKWFRKRAFRTSATVGTNVLNSIWAAPLQRSARPCVIGISSARRTCHLC